MPSIPAGVPMVAELPFTSGDCGRTSLPFDPPLVVAANDIVTIRLGYDLAQAVVSGAPSSHSQCSIIGHDPNGVPHCFRACVDTDATSRVCMDFPDFNPTAVKL